jgi:hypothetical protein
LIFRRSGCPHLAFGGIPRSCSEAYPFRRRPRPSAGGMAIITAATISRSTSITATTITPGTTITTVTATGIANSDYSPALRASFHLEPDPLKGTPFARSSERIEGRIEGLLAQRVIAEQHALCLHYRNGNAISGDREPLGFPQEVGAVPEQGTRQAARRESRSEDKTHPRAAARSDRTADKGEETAAQGAADDDSATLGSKQAFGG